MKRKVKKVSPRAKRAKVVRAKIVDKSLRMVISSLESHLDWTWKPLGNKALNGDNAFQKETVREYALLLHLISQLY